MSLGQAWAVRVNVSGGGPVWLNHGGGYSIARFDRKLWRDYDDALVASHQWDACNPKIIRVRFSKRAAQRQGVERKP